MFVMFPRVKARVQTIYVQKSLSCVIQFVSIEKLQICFNGYNNQQSPFDLRRVRYTRRSVIGQSVISIKKNHDPPSKLARFHVSRVSLYPLHRHYISFFSWYLSRYSRYKETRGNGGGEGRKAHGASRVTRSATNQTHQPGKCT